MADESGLDQLINQLEDAIETTSEVEFKASATLPPKRCTFRVLTEAYRSLTERKAIKQGKLIQLSGNEAQFQVKENVIKGYQIEAHIFFEKNAEGETIFSCNGTVTQSKRISGGYGILVEIITLEKRLIPASQRFLECAVSGDFATWNRWSSGLKTGAQLRELDISHMILTNFDLCAADFTGSNFTGSNLNNSNLSCANLENCNLAEVSVIGTDLFRVRLPRKYIGLLAASGMVEITSVTLLD